VNNWGKGFIDALICLRDASNFNRGSSKLQISNIKQIPMTKMPNDKSGYDLEERTFQFAKDVFINTGKIKIV
jgi:hypothetical protein